MGTQRGDNGGERPSEGGGLPDLPPEWGTIVVPDDAASLDREAGKVRREIRRSARRARWRRLRSRRAERFRPVRSSTEPEPAPLGLPLIIMAIAVIATMASLFAIAWPGRTTSPTTTPTANQTVAIQYPRIPDLTLQDGTGQPVRLADLLPAVILLTDGCTCARLISDTAWTVPDRVHVLVVSRTLPVLPDQLPSSTTVRALIDPQDRLRAVYAGSPPASGVLAVLVSSHGQVAYAAPVSAIDEIEVELTRL